MFGRARTQQIENVVAGEIYDFRDALSHLGRRLRLPFAVGASGRARSASEAAGARHERAEESRRLDAGDTAAWRDSEPFGVREE